MPGITVEFFALLKKRKESAQDQICDLLHNSIDISMLLYIIGFMKRCKIVHAMHKYYVLCVISIRSYTQYNILGNIHLPQPYMSNIVGVDD